MHRSNGRRVSSSPPNSRKMHTHCHTASISAQRPARQEAAERNNSMHRLRLHKPPTKTRNPATVILSGAFPPPLTSPGRHTRVHLDNDPDANLQAVVCLGEAMTLASNVNSAQCGGSEFRRAGTANPFQFSFLDLGNLSEMSFRVFSGTTVEKRVFFTSVLPWNVMVTNWREFVRLW
jgi:hypothetical protein